MINYGLKLWSRDPDNYFFQAVNLCNTGQVDLIELYVHPEMINAKKLKILQGKNITIHATHNEHGFEVFDINDEKIKFFRDKIMGLANYFSTNKIILHPGAGTDKNKFKENMEKIFNSKIIFENLPKVSLDEKLFFGYSLDQLKWIKKNFSADFCLDFSHAIKSAFSQKINYKVFILDLINKLKPTYFHICDGFVSNEMDKHLNLGEGNFDLRWIKNELLKISQTKNIDLVFEVPKNSNDLDNDINNIEYFKKL